MLNISLLRSLQWSQKFAEEVQILFDVRWLSRDDMPTPMLHNGALVTSKQARELLGRLILNLTVVTTINMQRGATDDVAGEKRQGISGAQDCELEVHTIGLTPEVAQRSHHSRTLGESQHPIEWTQVVENFL